MISHETSEGMMSVLPYEVNYPPLVLFYTSKKACYKDQAERLLCTAKFFFNQGDYKMSLFFIDAYWNKIQELRVEEIYEL